MCQECTSLYLFMGQMVCQLDRFGSSSIFLIRTNFIWKVKCSHKKNDRFVHIFKEVCWVTKQTLTSKGLKFLSDPYFFDPFWLAYKIHDSPHPFFKRISNFNEAFQNVLTLNIILNFCSINAKQVFLYVMF